MQRLIQPSQDSSGCSLLKNLAAGMFEEVVIDLAGDATSRGQSPLSAPVPVGKGERYPSLILRD